MDTMHNNRDLYDEPGDDDTQTAERQSWERATLPVEAEPDEDGELEAIEGDSGWSSSASRRPSAPASRSPCMYALTSKGGKPASRIFIGGNLQVAEFRNLLIGEWRRLFVVCFDEECGSGAAGGEPLAGSRRRHDAVRHHDVEHSSDLRDTPTPARYRA
jgi:hypothetical protein